MTIQSQLNKLLKRDLESLCSKFNVEIPSKIKTKKDLIQFMIGYANWQPTLEEILNETTTKKTTSRRTSRSTSGPSSDKIIQLEHSIQDLTNQFEAYQKKMDVELSKLKSQIDDTEKESETTDSDNLEIQVLEAIPEEEFTHLEDVFEFVEDIPKRKFKDIIKRLLLFRAIDGEEAEGEIQVELIDGTMIGMVRR